MATGRLPAAGPAPDNAGLRSRAAGHPGPRGPVIVLGYGHSGVGFLGGLLSSYRELACTSGTGLLPLCEAAAATWRQIENRAGPLSPLALASIRALTGSLITTALAGTGKVRWCEIAFAHPRCAETFLEVYPSARILCGTGVAPM